MFHLLRVRSKSSLLFLFSVAFIVSSLSSSIASADVVIGNIPSTYSGGTIIQDPFQKAVRFQMGITSYELENVKVILYRGGGTEADAQTYAEVRADDGTPNTPGALMATLSPNPLTGTNYGSNPTEVTFTPSTSVLLEANTIYWILLRGGSSSNYLFWTAPSGGQTPPADGVGTYLQYGLYNGTNWVANNTYNAVEINAVLPAAIPTLNEWGMIIMAFLLIGSTIWTMKKLIAIG